MIIYSVIFVLWMKINTCVSAKKGFLLVLLFSLQNYIHKVTRISLVQTTQNTVGSIFLLITKQSNEKKKNNYKNSAALKHGGEGAVWNLLSELIM